MQFNENKAPVRDCPNIKVVIRQRKEKKHPEHLEKQEDPEFNEGTIYRGTGREKFRRDKWYSGDYDHARGNTGDFKEKHQPMPPTYHKDPFPGMKFNHRKIANQRKPPPTIKASIPSPNIAGIFLPAASS